MRFVGVDLHKQTITVAVVEASRKLLTRKRFSNLMSAEIVSFLKALGEFGLTVEATASYEWFVQLVEPFAARVVLAHPGKLRIIAESTRKSDKLDAKVLAEMLALDQIPASYRPTPRQRAHRQLVRQRQFWQKKITSVRAGWHGRCRRQITSVQRFKARFGCHWRRLWAASVVEIQAVLVF